MVVPFFVMLWEVDFVVVLVSLVVVVLGRKMERGIFL
jgi:hypothetical protein